MRSMTRTLSGLGLLLAVSLAGAQQPALIPPAQTSAPKKSALEEALDLALKNNPDLRVAASKRVLAEAELSRTRLQITQKVAAAYADVLTERAVVAEMERQLAATRTLIKKGVASLEDLSKAEFQSNERKAKLATAERELEHLQGKGGRDDKQANLSLAEFYDRTGHPKSATFYRSLGQDGRVFAGRGVQGFDLFSVKTETTDKLRQTLQKKTTLSGKEMSLTEYLTLVRKTAGGMNVHANTQGEAWKETIDFDFDGVTIGGMLQFLEDNLTGHQILVREYGLLIVPKDKVPPGALTLSAFLEAGGEKEKPKAKVMSDPVEGKITRVDNNLCTISIGSKAGLTKGQRLEVYRTVPDGKYLGSLVVTDLAEDKAVCKTVGKLNATLTVGDMVTTKLVGK